MIGKQQSIKNKAFIYLGLGIMAIIMILPLLLLVNISFLSSAEFAENPLQISIINKSFTELFANYIQAWEIMQVVKKFFLTLAMALISSVIAIILSLMIAFPLSRNHFKGANKVYIFLLASMFFPSSLIAFIIIFQAMGLYDNPLGLILLWGTGGIAMNTFMLTGFIKSVPRELDDAAFADGCSYLKYMFSILMPLIKPIISTLFIMKFIGVWNDFLNPFIYMTTDTWRTLSCGLYYFQRSFSADWNLVCAATILVALPMVIVFIFFQRFIIEGLSSGALKG